MPFGIVGLTHPKIAQGMDYWRLLVPLLHMRSLGYPCVLTRLGNDLPSFDDEPPKVIILAEPYAATHGEDRLTKKLCRKLGALYVVDVADDPTPREGGPMKRSPELWDAKLECIAEADLVTVNTEPMAEIIAQWNPNVAVLPDLAEVAHWEGERPKDRPDAPTLGVRGGATHEKDWAILEEPWRKIAEEYPEVHFVSAGLQVPWLKKLPENRYHHRPWSLITQYQEQLRWIDVGCAPLGDDPFNVSKSPIAFYDFSLAGAVTLASAGTIYDEPIRSSESGFLSDPASWYELLRFICELPIEQREVFAQCAKEWVIENRCMNQWRALERYNVYHYWWERMYERDPVLSSGA